MSDAWAIWQSFDIKWLVIAPLLILFWWLGRVSASRSTQNSSPQATHLDNDQRCIEGLNYLLNNQQDKALELFIRLVQVNDDTIETHIALGNIYRRTGETEKAIQLHQNLLARPNLSVYQRSLSLFELGMDFLNAGLLDRAENLFREVLGLGVQKQEALQRLLSIYVLEKSWQAAAEVAEQLLGMGDKLAQQTLTHCYCELAEIELKNNRNSSARGWIERALQQDDQCARACLLKLEMLYRGGDYQGAKQALKHCACVDKGCVDQFVLAARQIYTAVGEMDEYREFLQQAAAQVQTDLMIIELAGLLRQDQHYEEALQLLQDYLSRNPSLRVLDYLLKHYRDNLQEAESLWSQLQHSLQQLEGQEKTHQCRSCGFESNLHHWQCPSCSEWSTMMARHVQAA